MGLENLSKSGNRFKPINNIHYNECTDNFNDCQLLRLFEKAKKKVDRETNRIKLPNIYAIKNKKI
jgi:hypothetical protein